MTYKNKRSERTTHDEMRNDEKECNKDISAAATSIVDWADSESKI